MMSDESTVTVVVEQEKPMLALGMYKKGNEWQVVKVPFLPSEGNFTTVISTNLRDEAIETFKIAVAKSGFMG